MSKLIHRQFTHQCAKTPDNIALRSDSENITYRQLELRANNIAQSLIRSGITSGDVVGIYMNRCNNLVATILGILKSGACYLPLDPYYPSDRLAYMAEHSEAKLVITDNLNSMDWLSNQIPTLDVNDIDFSSPTTPDLPQVDEQSLCYIMYTSGSTGKPKGVMIAHHTVVNYLNWMQDAYQLTTNSRGT